MLPNLTTILYICNFFIFLYKIAYEFLQINFIFNNDLRIVLNSQIKLIIKTKTNRRQINFFINDKMIVIIFNEYEAINLRDIVLIERRNNSKIIKIYRIHQNYVIYMSLYYVFLFFFDEYKYY